jgi:cytochrome c-type biogenesis protein CcmE
VKVRYIVALVVCIGAVAWMVTSLSANLDYMEPVSTAVAHRAGEANRTLRIGGVVKPGTIDKLAQHGADFELTDGNATVKVQLQSEPPQLFNDCVPVVVQGHWQGATFVGDSVLVRHGSTYSRAKMVAAAQTKSGCSGTGGS